MSKFFEQQVGAEIEANKQALEANENAREDPVEQVTALAKTLESAPPPAPIFRTPVTKLADELQACRTYDEQREYVTNNLAVIVSLVYQLDTWQHTLLNREKTLAAGEEGLAARRAAHSLEAMATAIVAPSQPENRVAQIADKVLDQILCIQGTLDEFQTLLAADVPRFLNGVAVARQALKGGL